MEFCFCCGDPIPDISKAIGTWIPRYPGKKLVYFCRKNEDCGNNRAAGTITNSPTFQSISGKTPRK